MPSPPTSPIDPDQKAPAFTLIDQHGQKQSLAEAKGRWVVLYFYPKDNTPGCTKEACQFRDRSDELTDRGVIVLGVSPDDQASHKKFNDKHKLNFPLLVDEDARLCKKYGVWQEKSMYGRKFMGVVRTTYLIDPRGRVAHRFDKVKVANHVDQVIKTLDELATQ